MTDKFKELMEFSNNIPPYPLNEFRMTIKPLIELLLKAEEALKKYADERSWPTRPIALGNGHFATGIGLGHINSGTAKEALSAIDAFRKGE